MNMNSVRRNNLKAIIANWKDGTVAQFGRDTGIDESRLSQVLSEKYRQGNNFGEKAARAIEAAAGLPSMSLDKIPDINLPESRDSLRSVNTPEQRFDRNTASASFGKRAIPVISA